MGDVQSQTVHQRYSLISQVRGRVTSSQPNDQPIPVLPCLTHGQARQDHQSTKQPGCSKQQSQKSHPMEGFHRVKEFYDLVAISAPIHSSPNMDPIPEHPASPPLLSLHREAAEPG